jgi:hypothetical protein
MILWYRYEENTKLSGILYFHRIVDPRMSGAAMKNGRMFRKLCGHNALKNVFLVTTHWDAVEQSIGESREAELRQHFWKDMIDAGAEVFRFNRTKSSAFDILQRLVPKKPVVLQLQEEMKDGATIGETSVGKEINKEINLVKAAAKQQLEEIKKEMTEAANARDAAWQRDLAAAKAAHEEQLRLAERRERELRESNQAREMRLVSQMEQQIRQVRAESHQAELNAANARYNDLKEHVDHHRTELNAADARYNNLQAHVAHLEARLNPQTRRRVVVRYRSGVRRG